MNKKRIIRNQKGFTLIEIIAVLIILGVLAAVAVPKFVDLTQTATEEALDGAIAAGMSQVSMDYARVLLENGSIPAMTDLDSQVSTDLGGDFTYTFTGTGGTGGIIEVTVSDGTNSRTSTWQAPQ